LRLAHDDDGISQLMAQKVVSDIFEGVGGENRRRCPRRRDQLGKQCFAQLGKTAGEADRRKDHFASTCRGPALGRT
jgi:hypothetical protein